MSIPWDPASSPLSESGFDELLPLFLAIQDEPADAFRRAKVDGVYDCDPMTYPNAVRFDHLTYMEAINRRLEVMDSTAISLCMDNNLPILVLNLWNQDDLRRAIYGEKVRTLVTA